MLNAIIGAAVGGLIALMVVAFVILLRGLREFTSSISGLTTILKPFLSNPQLPLLVESLPALFSELRMISKGIEAMTSALKIFNQAVLNKGTDASAPVETGEESGVYVYNEGAAAEKELEFQRALFKEPPAG